MAIEERNHSIIQEVGRRDRRLAIIELGASDLGVSIDEGLLINASHSLQVADIECILRAAIARMLALELAMGLLFRLGFLQRGELGLGQHQAPWALLASKALSRLFMFSRSWRSHKQRTPAGETVSPRFRSSLATRS